MGPLTFLVSGPCLFRDVCANILAQISGKLMWACPLCFGGLKFIFESILICQMICYSSWNSGNLLENHLAHGYRKGERLDEEI